MLIRCKAALQERIDLSETKQKSGECDVGAGRSEIANGAAGGRERVSFANHEICKSMSQYNRVQVMNWNHLSNAKLTLSGIDSNTKRKEADSAVDSVSLCAPDNNNPTKVHSADIAAAAAYEPKEELHLYLKHT